MTPQHNASSHGKHLSKRAVFPLVFGMIFGFCALTCASASAQTNSPAPKSIDWELGLGFTLQFLDGQPSYNAEAFLEFEAGLLWTFRGGLGSPFLSADIGESEIYDSDFGVGAFDPEGNAFLLEGSAAIILSQTAKTHRVRAVESTITDLGHVRVIDVRDKGYAYLEDVTSRHLFDIGARHYNLVLEEQNYQRRDDLTAVRSLQDTTFYAGYRYLRWYTTRQTRNGDGLAASLQSLSLYARGTLVLQNSVEQLARPSDPTDIIWRRDGVVPGFEVGTKLYSFVLQTGLYGEVFAFKLGIEFSF